jgi:hypothetical protein
MTICLFDFLEKLFGWNEKRVRMRARVHGGTILQRP